MMLRRHLHAESADVVVKLLNDRHHTELTEEDLAEALKSLRLKIVPTDEPGTVPEAEGTNRAECIDRSDECAGELTTVLDSRHVRCEKHWSIFLESEGM